MKILNCEYKAASHPGVLSESGDRVVFLKDMGFDFEDVPDLIRRCGRDGLKAVQAALAEREAGCRKAGKPCGVPLADVRLLAPIPHPHREIVCMGRNYQSLSDELTRAYVEEQKARTWPIFFGKGTNRCLGPGEDIDSHSDFVSTLDYECELALIIAKDAYHVALEDAEDYVFGYMILDDMRACELDRHKQNYFGKSLDSTTATGPWIVTADEFEYPPERDLKLWVNGELRQHGNTRELIFGISEIIRDLTQGMTLQACTIISTGSPSGTCFGMDPQVFLKPGDVIKCWIDGIGEIVNTVR